MKNKDLINKRDVSIDALKGFAAILVVLGHVTQFCFNSTYETNFLFKIPYSFHMMLFFFISGHIFL